MTERVKKTEAPEFEGNAVFLRREDQRTVMEVVLVIALLLGLSTGWYAWQNGGLQHLETATHQPVTIQVDLNLADWTEISVLPNIGEKTARDIVDWRERHGRFPSLQSLTRIDGIGAVTVRNIQPYVLPISDSIRLAGEPDRNQR